MKIMIQWMLCIVVSFMGVLQFYDQANAAAEETIIWTKGNSKTTDPNKTWKIHFSSEIDTKTVLPEHVYVTNQKGQKVAVILEVQQQTIQVTPKNPYAIGENYTLWITDKVKPSKANLKNEFQTTYFPFQVVKEEDSVKTIKNVLDDKVEFTDNTSAKIPEKYKAVFNKKNAKALQGANIAGRFTQEIEGVDTLTVNTGGNKLEYGMLDFQNQVFDFNMIINTSFLTIKNATINGNVTLTSKVYKVNLHSLVINGEYELN